MVGMISAFNREGASSSTASALTGSPGKAATDSWSQERKGEGGGKENPVTFLQILSSRESALYHIAGGNYLKAS